MENTIILQGITVSDLLTEIDSIVERQIKDQVANLILKKTPKFVTREEVASMLKVSMPTINVWSKQGILISYRIGRRVYFKSNELEDALVKSKIR